MIFVFEIENDAIKAASNNLTGKFYQCQVLINECLALKKTAIVVYFLMLFEKVFTEQFSVCLVQNVPSAVLNELLRGVFFSRNNELYLVEKVTLMSLILTHKLYGKTRNYFGSQFFNILPLTRTLIINN